MLISPRDFSFTFAAIFSIICTGGCVAGTTSIQRIVTWCALATAIVPNVNMTNVKKRFIGFSPYVERRRAAPRCESSPLGAADPHLQLSMRRQKAQACAVHSRCDRSAYANPGHAMWSPRERASTLNDSPISEGDVNVCTADASRR